MVESGFTELLGSFRRLEGAVLLVAFAGFGGVMIVEWVCGFVRALWHAHRPR